MSSTFSGNSAGYGGGAIFNFRSWTRHANSTCSTNEAADAGRGPLKIGTASVVNSTFSGSCLCWGYFSDAATLLATAMAATIYPTTRRADSAPAPVPTARPPRR